MKKTKIEYCDATWNPVTGCLHNCEYCYARRIARRYEGVWDGGANCKLIYHSTTAPQEVTGGEYGGLGLKYRIGNDNCGEPKLINAPYPYGFHPTLHRHRIESGLLRWKKPRTIFVGSMTDLFGNWIPDRWIEEVFETCAASPQHRYLFLTKNPQRYCDLATAGKLPKKYEQPNWWFGSTITQRGQRRFPGFAYNKFLSIEPLMESLDVGLGSFGDCEFVIIGAQTSNCKGKGTPEKEWIDNIVEAANLTHMAIFMKDSLIPIIGEANMLRELPWTIKDVCADCHTIRRGETNCPICGCKEWVTPEEWEKRLVAKLAD